MTLAEHPLYRADLEAAAGWPGLDALRGATVLVTGRDRFDRRLPDRRARLREPPKGGSARA